MIRSMTGYGKAIAEAEGKKITVEVRSLNSKQFDLNLRMPSLYREKEPVLRNELSQRLERGKVDFSVYMEITGETGDTPINKTLVKNYFRQLKEISAGLGEERTDYLSLIVRMPDIFRNERELLGEEEAKKLVACSLKAIDDLNSFREDEGKSLEKELEKRIREISSLLASVEKADPLRIKTIRERLKKNLYEAIGKDKMDENRFEQELIFYFEKLDITEETVRLKTHCGYFLKTMKEKSSGRKLNFIAQEIGREINTIGSKANDAEIQQQVVQMKDELEKIKEQLNNVL